MKNFLILLAIGLIGAVVAFAAIEHRMGYVRSLEVTTAKQREAAETERAKELNVLRTENENIKKDNQFLRANCLKGATAYSRLSLTVQRQVGTIDCGE